MPMELGQRSETSVTSKANLTAFVHAGTTSRASMHVPCLLVARSVLQLRSRSGQLEAVQRIVEPEIWLVRSGGVASGPGNEWM